MKIEIDLNDVLHDDQGDATETLAESIRRQVVDRLAQDARRETEAKIKAAVDAAIGGAINAALADRVPAIIESLLDTEYTPVSRYGERAAPTTVRAELVKHLTDVAVYKPTTYSSDKNLWTKSIDAAVEKTLAEFKAAWVKQVDNRFLGEAMAFAAEAFAKRAGIRKRSRAMMAVRDLLDA